MLKTGNFDAFFREKCLTKNKRYVSNSASSTSGNGGAARKRPIAHMRRAHWHLFWTGPGRKVPKVRWVSAFQAGGHEESKNAVVHIVKR